MTTAAHGGARAAIEWYGFAHEFGTRVGDSRGRNRGIAYRFTSSKARNAWVAAGPKHPHCAWARTKATREGCAHCVVVDYTEEVAP